MQPKQVHQGGMVIVMVDDVGDRMVSEFIGFPVGHTTLEATAGDPHAKPVGVVVPADLLAPGIVLDNRQPSHLSTPVHHGALEQATLLEVLYQGCCPAVGFPAGCR